MTRQVLATQVMSKHVSMKAIKNEAKKESEKNILMTLIIEKLLGPLGRLLTWSS